jgi:anti-sigma regulatory factor (Ser/Thr protein kinase)
LNHIKLRMPTIILPRVLDRVSFELVLEQSNRIQKAEKVVVDARQTRRSAPYGLAALLALGESLHGRASLTLPENQTTLSEWAANGFFSLAPSVFDLVGGTATAVPSDESVVLAATRITLSNDVHTIVNNVQRSTRLLLVNTLGFDPSVAMRLTTALSEICQNVVEHSGGHGGWVLSRSYELEENGARTVVGIAVCDAGIGFRRSIETSSDSTLKYPFDDASALEATVMRGASRFKDPGRGQGLAGVRRFITKVGGSFSVRSGTARIFIAPAWERAGNLLEKGLPEFAGAQVEILIPMLVTE